jgi:hypothetical protein
MTGYPFDTVCRPYRNKKKKTQIKMEEGDGEQKSEKDFLSRTRFSVTSRDGGSRNGLEGLCAPPPEPSQGWGREVAERHRQLVNIAPQGALCG